MKTEAGAWVSFDGHAWCMVAGDGASRTLPCAEDALLPEISEPVDGLFWPVERLLMRPFRLPLRQARLIDADIIGQELAEQTGEDATDWWLTWQASACEGGVAGTWFALPESVCEAIDADVSWKAMPRLVVDATARLGAWLSQAGGSPLAILDMDADGLFLGFWRDGAWQGIRRLNAAQPAWDEMAVEAGRSLAAMGWHAEAHGAVGRLPPAFVATLGIRDWQGEACEPADLPGRHTANLALVGALAGAMPASAVNLRHGRWSVRRRSVHRGAWRRPLILAAMLMLVWVLGTGVHLYRLSHQQDRYRQQIAAAFHRGLPHETVMLDALAQLRKAAGGASAAGDDGGEWLHQMQAVAKVYRQHPWQLRELDFAHGRMHMSGTVQGLNALNQIRQALSTHLGRDVELADTDLQGQKVAFRMNW